MTILMAQHLAAHRELTAATSLLEEILEDARHDEVARAKAKTHLAVLSSGRGNDDEARRQLAEAIPVLEVAPGESRAYLFALMRMAVLLADGGRHDEAITCLERAETGAEDDRFVRAQILDEMAMVEAKRGNEERAVALHEEALPIFREQGAHHSVVINLLAQARLVKRLKQFADAGALAESAGQVAAAEGLPTFAADAYTLAGKCHRLAGNLATSEAALRHAVAVSQGLANVNMFGAQYEMALLYATEGALDATIFHAREALAHAREENRDHLQSWIDQLLVLRNRSSSESQSSEPAGPSQ